MMKWFESRILWGGLLILGGVIFLLQNLGILRIGSLYWALLLILAGVFFVSIFIQNRANWWALVPAISLFSIAVVVVVDWISPQVGAAWGGFIILGGVGISFFVVYLFDRQQWWAVIPMGVFLTLAAAIRLGGSATGIDMAGLLFLGLGLTFVVLALLPTPHGPMRWAWIPAVVLALIGALLIASLQQVIIFIWPVALILLGGYLVLQTMRPQNR